MSSTVSDIPTQSASEGECWIVNSGASHHMSPNIHFLDSVVPYNGDKKIIVGNGTGLDVQNIGTMTIPSPPNTLYLRNVLHVPMLIVNLLSVKQLCKDNHSWFICDDLNFFVQDKATWVILYQGKSSSNELFRIPVHVFPKLLTSRWFLFFCILGESC